uniref:Uncharacterized protein n=1 Tax=Setaria viridis TaxID=4556 RepID=A0A4U6WGG1_SETVI|nr:hypothetical protein SEVIR_1G019900v2 [Setaria viridis]
MVSRARVRVSLRRRIRPYPPVRPPLKPTPVGPGYRPLSRCRCRCRCRCAHAGSAPPLDRDSPKGNKQMGIALAVHGAFSLGGASALNSLPPDRSTHEHHKVRVRHGTMAPAYCAASP